MNRAGCPPAGRRTHRPYRRSATPWPRRPWPDDSGSNRAAVGRWNRGSARHGRGTAHTRRAAEAPAPARRAASASGGVVSAKAARQAAATASTFHFFISSSLIVVVFPSNTVFHLYPEKGTQVKRSRRPPRHAQHRAEGSLLSGVVAWLATVGKHSEPADVYAETQSRCACGTTLRLQA